jgi:hypothetical protein
MLHSHQTDLAESKLCSTDLTCILLGRTEFTTEFTMEFFHTEFSTTYMVIRAWHAKSTECSVALVLRSWWAYPQSKASAIAAGLSGARS